MTPMGSILFMGQEKLSLNQEKFIFYFYILISFMILFAYCKELKQSNKKIFGMVLILFLLGVSLYPPLFSYLLNLFIYLLVLLFNLFGIKITFIVKNLLFIVNFIFFTFFIRFFLIRRDKKKDQNESC